MEKGQIKKVKTRTPYKVVKQYEAEFKSNFSKVMGSMMRDLLNKVDKFDDK